MKIILSKIKLKRALFITFAATQFAAVSFADDNTGTTNEDVGVLKQELQQVEQKVDTLERQQEKDHAAAAAVITNSPHVTVDANGVTVISANSNFVANLGAWIQVDSRTFFENGHTPGIDGFLLRRSRLILSGTVYQNFDYFFNTDFGGSTVQILDAYINYHYDPAVQFQFGKFKPPVGLEALQSDIYTFFNERSLATDLVPYRDIGAMFHGSLLDGVFSYYTAILNGAPDLTTTTLNANFDNDVAFAGRVFVLPFKETSITPLQGLGIGVSGTYEHDDTNAAAAGLTPGYVTDGQEKFFTYSSSTVPDGTHWRISPQAYYFYGPFGLMGEYVVSAQQVKKISAPVATAYLNNTAWEVSGGWVLTGENDTYSGVSPRHPFSIRNGNWGAWQVVGRFAQLNVDSAAFPNFASAATSASKASAWAAGLNWYLNNNLRVNASFSHTWFNGGATGTVTKRPENVVFTRVQLAF